jgi:anti-anti-sigma factor
MREGCGHDDGPMCEEDPMVRPAPTLQIRVLAGTHATSLSLCSALDAHTARSLVADAERVILKGHRDLILDCKDLDFCDSYGLRAMNILADRVRPDGSITITRAPRMLVSLLDIAGLSGRFEYTAGAASADVSPPSPTAESGPSTQAPPDVSPEIHSPGEVR